MHGIKTSTKHSPWRHLDFQRWYTHKQRQDIDAQIRSILKLHRVSEKAQVPTVLPPVWGHKTEALTGDTIYLEHHNHIQSFILSALDKVEPEVGRVSTTSPIGRALLGRHQGDKVHLMTLDGEIDYTILKII